MEDANSIEYICKALSLPPEICRSYAGSGVRRVYDWQRDCLFTTDILSGNNLVYCAPTSGGKTLVAELVILRTVLVQKKKVVFVLPYVSLVTEKERYFKRLLTIYNRSQPMQERVKVRGFYGDQGGSRSYKENILICTIEKANGIFNSLTMRGKAGRLGCLVFDEMHVLGNTFNGYLLEILISKIKCLVLKSAAQSQAAQVGQQQQQQASLLQNSLQQSCSSMMFSRSFAGANAAAAASAVGQSSPPLAIQMIALSATMGNVEELARWLGGALYRTNFRPVPLLERVKAGNEVLDTQGKVLARLPPPASISSSAKAGGAAGAGELDSDHVLLLCQQALRKGQQVLIFCSSKFACLQTCRMLVNALTLPTKTPFNARSGGNAPLLTHLNLLLQQQTDSSGTEIDSSAQLPQPQLDVYKRERLLEGRRQLLAQLQTESPQLEETLRTALLHGVAYHNAGLTSGERSLVERAFRSGQVSILAATSTLAAGVNLPAGCVLVRSMSIGRDYLNVMQYKQMCGRAGRMGQGGNVGESFLLVRAAENERALQLCNQTMPDVVSQMHPSADGGNALLKAVLEVVGIGVCESVEEAHSYIQQTLLFQQAQHSSRSGSEWGAEAVLSAAQSILSFLIGACILDCKSSGNSQPGGAEAASTTVKLKITRFGKAIMQSNVNPDEAIVMYDSLLRAQEGLNLESTLHLLYLVAPMEHRLHPDFRKLMNMYETSRRSENKLLATILDAVGLEYAALGRWQGSPPTKSMMDMCCSAVRLHSIQVGDRASSGTSTANRAPNPHRNVRREEWTALSRCKRLWAALALQSLLDGRPIQQVAKEFDVDAADIDALLNSAQIMASKVARFCEQIGWTATERLVKEFQATLQLGRGDSKELVALLAVPQMPRKIAKVLSAHPSTATVEAFLAAPPSAVAQLLQLSIGFELQELERIEVSIEAGEAHLSCSQQEPDSSSGGSDAPTALDSATSSRGSRDELTKQRLLSLIRALQSTARDQQQREVDRQEGEAADLMTALLHSGARSEGADSAVGGPGNPVELMSEGSESQSDASSDTGEGDWPDNAADSEVSDADAEVADEEKEERDAMIALEEDEDAELGLDAVGTEGVWPGSSGNRELDEEGVSDGFNEAPRFPDSTSTSSLLGWRREPLTLRSLAALGLPVGKGTALKRSLVVDTAPVLDLGAVYTHNAAESRIPLDAVCDRSPLRKVARLSGDEPTAAVSALYNPPNPLQSFYLSSALAYRPSANLPPSALFIPTAQPVAAEAFLSGTIEMSVAAAVENVPLKSPSLRRTTSQHRVTFSPLPAATVAGCAEPSLPVCEFLLGEEELGALMDELESAGVIERAPTEGESHSEDHCAGLVEGGGGRDDGDVCLYYYPVDLQSAEQQLSAEELDAFQQAVDVPSVYDYESPEKAAATSLQQQPLTRSACKISIIQVRGEAPRPTVGATTSAPPTDEICRLMDDLERRGVIPGLATPALPASTTPFAWSAVPSTQELLRLQQRTECDFAFYETSPLQCDPEASRDTVVSYSEGLRDGFETAMQLSGSTPTAQSQTQSSPRVTAPSQPLSSSSQCRVPTPSAVMTRTHSLSRTATAKPRTPRWSPAFRSPYATPFTTSKVRTPGHYLYYPVWQADTGSRRGSSRSRLRDEFPRIMAHSILRRGGGSQQGHSPATAQSFPIVVAVEGEGAGLETSTAGPRYPCDVVPAAVCSGTAKAGFGMRLVSSAAHCRTFIEQLRSARCVSFELLFRPLPAGWLGRYRVANSNATADGPSVHSWAPYISWACCKSTSVTCTANDHFLEAALGNDTAAARNRFRSPHVLVGAALSFGDSYGYYLPLPTPLPLPADPEDQSAADVCTGNVSVADSLPAVCRELVAAFVGFGCLLQKCPALSAVLQPTGVQTDLSPSHKAVQSNPLFLVSRCWSYSARKALLLAWRKGGCVEWRLLSELMQNRSITKVAVHAKTALVVLRERDVLVEGPLADPGIANSLLQQCQAPTAGAPDPVTLNIPQLTPSAPSAPAVNTQFICPPSVRAGKKIACFRAVAVMRAMAKLEERLRQADVLDLFRNIEMALLYSASDAEHCGMCVSAPFLSSLRQGLSSRQELIEQYFVALFGPDFNAASPMDVAQMRRKLTGDFAQALQSIEGAEKSLGALVRQHPLMRLISEHRSLTRALPLLAGVLGSRYFERVRAVYSTLGTETGRIILNSPPLQQVPKKVQYVCCEKASLHAELESIADLEHRQVFVSSLNSSNNNSGSSGKGRKPVSSGRSAEDGSQWVRVVSLNKSASLRASRSLQQGQAAGAVDYSLGRLVQVLSHASISQPASGSPAAASQSEALVDRWRQAGFLYTDEDAQRICQVLVEFPANRYSPAAAAAVEGVAEPLSRYAYPADKVFRTDAPISPPVEEVRWIEASLSPDWAAQRLQGGDITASADAMYEALRTEVSVREGFQASAGFVLVAADYSQVELRLLAHFAADSDLISAFEQGIDVFRAIAERWLRTPQTSITDAQRNQVKQICYALIYGAGPALVAEQAGVALEEAQRMMQDFLRSFPGIQKFLSRTKKRCRKQGFVQTLLGRRRYLGDIRCEDRKRRARAERQAVNTLCQGSAADLIKLAMVNIHTRLAALEEQGCRDRERGGVLQFRRPRRVPGGGLYRQLDDVRPVLQVHDELIFEVRPSDVLRVAEVVRECMEGAVALRVPLQVKLSVGPSWGELQPLLSPAPAAVVDDSTVDAVVEPAGTATQVTKPPSPAAARRVGVAASALWQGGGLGDGSRRAGALNLPPSQAAPSTLLGAAASLAPPVARDLFGRD